MSATQAPSTAIPRRIIGALTLGLITLAVFTLRAWRQTQPIIDVRLFTDSRFSLHVGACILFEISALALSFILPNPTCNWSMAAPPCRPVWWCCRARRSEPSWPRSQADSMISWAHAFPSSAAAVSP